MARFDGEKFDPAQRGRGGIGCGGKNKIGPISPTSHIFCAASVQRFIGLSKRMRIPYPFCNSEQQSECNILFGLAIASELYIVANQGRLFEVGGELCNLNSRQIRRHRSPDRHASWRRPCRRHAGQGATRAAASVRLERLLCWRLRRRRLDGPGDHIRSVQSTLVWAMRRRREWQRRRSFATPVIYNMTTSFNGGGRIGYNWQPTPYTLLGLENDFGYLHLKGSVVMNASRAPYLRQPLQNWAIGTTPTLRASARWTAMRCSI